MFELWSEKNGDAKKLLSPNLGLREWDDLTHEEKDKIWHHISYWFEPGKNDNLTKIRIILSVSKLNELHKSRSFAENFLRNPSERNASQDFQHIFFNHKKDVVLELLSCFCKAILQERENKYSGLYRSDFDSDEKFEKAVINWKHQIFDKFAERINNVFEHFGINLFLSRSGFIERQSEKITKEIYVPVLEFFSDKKWENVNRELADAFKEYQSKTESGYSNCVTHAFSSLQAYIQILVNGKIGSSESIISLIKQAQEKGLIPNDKFTSEIFKNIDAILMRERGKTGDAHPKQEYANEKSARLVLNLIMIFFQHCMQSE